MSNNQCLCLTKTGYQCKNKSNNKEGYNHKFCTIHQNCKKSITSNDISPKIQNVSPKIQNVSPKIQNVSPKVDKSEILSKYPLETPKCYIFSNAIDNYKGKNLYSLENSLSKLRDCQVNSQKIFDYETEIKDLYAQSREILNLTKKDIIDNPLSYGKSILKYAYGGKSFDSLQNKLITPLLSRNELKTYSGQISQIILNMDKLKSKINDSHIEIDKKDALYSECGLEFVKIVDIFLKLVEPYSLVFYLYSLFPDVGEKLLEQYSNYLNKYIDILDNIEHELYVNFITNYNYYDLKMNSKGKDILMYKGVRGDSINRLFEMEDYFWLAYDLPTALKYITPALYGDSGQEIALDEFCNQLGVVGIYRIRDLSNLKLLDLSNIKSVKLLEDKIDDPKVLKSFKKSFKIMKNGEIEVIQRKSKKLTDVLISRWLCQNGYDGYTSDRIGNFHPEMMLCEPKKHLEYLGYYNHDDLGLEYCNEEYVKYKSFVQYIIN